MIKFILLLVVVLFALASVIIGIVNFNSRYSNTPDKYSYSFFNQFPYEMQDDTSMKYSWLLKLMVTLFSLSYALFGIYSFWLDGLDGYKPISDYMISVIFILIAFSIISEFFITLKNYKLHLIASSILFSGTCALYIYIGLYVLLSFKNNYHTSLAYLLLVLGGVMLVSLFIAPLRRWIYLEKEDKNGEVVYHRKKFSILPFMEWAFMAMDIVLVILLAIFAK